MASTPKPITFEEVESVVVRFAGDSGDGMQLTGTQFTNTSAAFGNDVSTPAGLPRRNPCARRNPGRRQRLSGEYFQPRHPDARR